MPLQRQLPTLNTQPTTHNLYSFSFTTLCCILPLPFHCHFIVHVHSIGSNNNKLHSRFVRGQPFRQLAKQSRGRESLALHYTWSTLVGDVESRRGCHVVWVGGATGKQVGSNWTKTGSSGINQRNEIINSCVLNHCHQHVISL